MIDWLRSDRLNPSVTVAGQELPIAIRRHARARRLTMRLAHDGSEVRVTLPAWGRTVDALVFARSRLPWLEQQLARVPRALAVAHGSTIPYRGRSLRIDWAAERARQTRLGEAELACGGPESSLAQRVRRFLEQEALRLNARDLEHYCARAGQPLPLLRLSQAQRRWGSCSSGRKDAAEAHERCIRINWRLVMAPDDVRRSVIAHEVAHLMHFDHSPAFHRVLATLYEGDLKAADRWLKEHGRALYAAFG
jgi:predicted metal-dependent hydrolase